MQFGHYTDFFLGWQPVKIYPIVDSGKHSLIRGATFLSTLNLFKPVCNYLQHHSKISIITFNNDVMIHQLFEVEHIIDGVL